MLRVDAYPLSIYAGLLPSYRQFGINFIGCIVRSLGSFLYVFLCSSSISISDDVRRVTLSLLVLSNPANDAEKSSSGDELDFPLLKRIAPVSLRCIDYFRKLSGRRAERISEPLLPG
jgi:hypothetical protein